MSSPLEAIEPYVSAIEQLVFEIGNNGGFKTEHHLAVEGALNGHLSRTLRHLVDGQVLREYGAFFTEESMSNELVSSLGHIDGNDRVLDAACGGGNLLIAYARKLRLATTWSQTLEQWGELLRGFDLHEQLVRATRTRLSLFAAQQGISKFGKEFIDGEPKPLEEVFPYIQTRNALSTSWPQAEVVLLNPPFNSVAVPPWCNWATGRVSQAPLFISYCLSQVQTDTKVRAILPDVLRAGSRYNRWRLQVGQLATWQGIKSLGQFDQKTAVDVFVLNLLTGKPSREFVGQWWEMGQNLPYDEAPNTQTVGDKFNVNVGRLVPHRDEELDEFEKYPFIDLHEAPAWKTIEPCTKYRRYKGTTFKTPFVLIRRTSRSKDKYRAVGTIVRSSLEGGEDVAVENHLLVARPLSNSLQECENLLQVLRSPQTTDWLNNRIRCRHLTVGAIKQIPYS